MKKLRKRLRMIKTLLFFFVFMGIAIFFLKRATRYYRAHTDEVNVVAGMLNVDADGIRDKVDTAEKVTGAYDNITGLKDKAVTAIADAFIKAGGVAGEITSPATEETLESLKAAVADKLSGLKDKGLTDEDITEMGDSIAAKVSEKLSDEQIQELLSQENLDTLLNSPQYLSALENKDNILVKLRDALFGFLNRAFPKIAEMNDRMMNGEYDIYKGGTE